MTTRHHPTQGKRRIHDSCGPSKESALFIKHQLVALAGRSRPCCSLLRRRGVCASLKDGRVLEMPSRLMLHETDGSLGCQRARLQPSMDACRVSRP